MQLIVDSFHDLDSLCPHAGTSQETVYSPGSLPHAGRGYQKNTGPSPGLEILIRLARSRFHLQIMVVGASKSNFFFQGLQSLTFESFPAENLKVVWPEGLQSLSFLHIESLGED